MKWRGLLVSVRDASEAASALAGGAAIIDIKEPLRGSLGRADPEVIAAIAATVQAQAPWTLACGELHEEMHAGGISIARHLAETLAILPALARPPAAVKIGRAGMANRDWQEALNGVWNSLPIGLCRVAVAYSDWQCALAPPPLAIIQAAVQAGCVTLLIDTFDKSAAGILQGVGPDQLSKWMKAARAVGLQVAVAGRITIDEIPQIYGLHADVVALRSAVCSNGRTGRVQKDLVQRASTLCGMA